MNQEGLPTRGPRGGDLTASPTREGRLTPLNAEFIEGLPTLHKFKKQETTIPGTKNEQPWHRMAAFMLLAGRTSSEIAAAAGVAPQTVSNLRGLRWFQELLAVLANETGQDITGLLQAEAAQSVETLVSLRDDPETPARVRLSAAQTLLEQAHGKPTQKIISAVSHSTHRNPSEEMEALKEELRTLRQR